MSTTTTDRNAAVKAQAEQIVTGGTDIRPRLAEVVARNASESEKSGGLVALVRATAEGARDGLDRSVPKDRDDALRQVIDALGDGLSQTALAGRLALQEAAGASQQYAHEDLARLRDDLTAVRDLFAETIDQALSSGAAFTRAQADAARRHAGRVAERIGPAVAQAIEVAVTHPVACAREGVQAGAGAGRCAVGVLFQALGRTMQRAGDQMRGEDTPSGAPSCAPR